MKNIILAIFEAAYMTLISIGEFFMATFLILGLFIFALIFGIFLKITDIVLFLVKGKS